MRGNSILVSCGTGGRKEQVVISGTPKPGTFMEIVPGTAPNAAGMFTYRARTGADGAVGPIAILLEDDEQGFTYADAYVSGKPGTIYWLALGDEVNALLRYQSGTGTAGASDVGDLMEIDGASGMLQADNDGASAPFYFLDDLNAAITADTHVWVKFFGNS